MRLPRVKEDAALAYERELRNDNYRDVPLESDRFRGISRKKGSSETEKALRKKKEKYRKIITSEAEDDDDGSTEIKGEGSAHRGVKVGRSTKSKVKEGMKQARAQREIKDEADW